MSTFTPTKIITLSLTLRLILLIYGAWQDAHSPVKYTDIDYLVFTDAARYVSRGASPYTRDTYRYTPLLAWMLVPTTWHVNLSIPGIAGSWSLFSFGKALFALADVLAGWLVARVLRRNYGLSTERAMKSASVWLLNPMVANISTRGSSEGLLGVLVAGVLWAVLNRRITLAGVLLGLGVHFKIYPFIYGVSVLWWLDDVNTSSTGTSTKKDRNDKKSLLQAFLSPPRLHLTFASLTTFLLLNLIMYTIYDTPFLRHTYLHHLTRIDHRHNFSPYSTLLYLSATATGSAAESASRIRFESLAFVPQIVLAVIVIPVLARRDLAGAMMAQTFAFVGFNKVCTSQYFLWYLIFLPFYLPSSSLLQKPRLGLLVAFLWIIAQALWLHQGFRLEFLGLSAFVPGLFLAGLFFFVVNCWILGVLVRDVGGVSAVPCTSAPLREVKK